MSKLRVAWTPQAGVDMKPFYVPVDSVLDGVKMMDILAYYDAYQFQNRIKGDYTNCGSLEIYNTQESEWEDWYFESEDEYFDDPREYLEEFVHTSQHEEFSKEVGSQIDWKKIEQMS